MSRKKQHRRAERVINLTADVATLRPDGGALTKLSQAINGIKSKIARAAQNAVAVILKNQANDYYFYGELDNLPNAIIQAVDNSGTATACVGRLEQFIKADGFVMEGLDTAKANKMQSLSALVDETALSVAYFEGYAWRLIFDNAGNIAKIYTLPIKGLRREGDGFKFNPLYGEFGKNETETVYYPEYDPERSPEARRALIAEQVKKHGKQLGEVLYIFRKGLGRYYDIYPVPRFYASIEDVISDGKISQLDLRNITQGFRTPVVISTGPIDDQNKDEDGKTAQDYFDENLQAFTGEDASPILHLKGSTEEFKPTVTVINVAEILDQTDRASDRIAKRVARIFEVPEVLIGIAKEGQLGNVQEVKNQMALFALSVYKKQDLIKQGFDLIKDKLRLEGLPLNPDFTLTTLKPFDFIPEAVIANLTPDEQKELFEISLGDSIDEAAVKSASRFGEFGVGGVQGILGVQTAVSQNTISVSAGVKVLETIYGFSQADAYQMLGGVQDNPEQLAHKAPERNDALANLTGRQLQGIQRIVRKFNKEELSYDQAAQLLISGFAMTEEQVGAWLITKEEEI